MDFPDDDVVPEPGSAKPPKEAKAKKARATLDLPRTSTPNDSGKHIACDVLA